MTINAIKERCGYKGGIRPEAPRCGACAHADDKPAGTKCKKHDMRVSYFGLCNDYEKPNIGIHDIGGTNTPSHYQEA